MKEVAPSNMDSMFVTFAVFQPLMSWLKAVALWNMALMSVTCAVSQPLMSWLKEVALENMASCPSPEPCPSR